MTTLRLVPAHAPISNYHSESIVSLPAPTRRQVVTSNVAAVLAAGMAVAGSAVTLRAAQGGSLPAAPGAVPPALDEALDADLVRLGDEIGRHALKWTALNTEHARLDERAWQLALQRYKVADDDSFGPGPSPQWLEEFGRAQEEVGFVAVDIELEGLHRKMDAPTRAAIATPAYTVKGLRTKVAIAMFANIHLWDVPSGQLDWRDQINRSLMEAAARVADMPIPEERQSEEVSSAR